MDPSAAKMKMRVEEDDELRLIQDESETRKNLEEALLDLEKKRGDQKEARVIREGYISARLLEFHEWIIAL